MFDLNNLVRENVKKLVPYSSARDEFTGEASVFLDANENSIGSPLPVAYNRYPDPHQHKIKAKLNEIKGIPADNIFLGNGSDECIDILFRVFCDPGKDNVIINPPTYGMYEVSANINDVAVRKINLTPAFQPDLQAIEAAIDDHTKMIFLCSPNNPTGNSLDAVLVETILNNYFGIVVIDEAYINFSRFRSMSQQLNEYPNLVILQTLSKAWGLAGLRLGMAFASTEIIGMMNKVKPPYNISQAAQTLVLEALDNVAVVNSYTKELVELRVELVKKLEQIPFIQMVYPSDANFLLVKVADPVRMYKHLLHYAIVVRDRSRVELCEGCLRITVGTPDENDQLLRAIAAFATLPE
jgi:histidinol-phosphate aminotransferase